VSSSHFFLSVPDLYVARYFGVLTLADLLNGIEACRVSTHFSPTSPELIDFSQIANITIDLGEFRQLIAVLHQVYRQNSGTVAMYILVAGDHFYAHMRQFELLSADLKGLKLQIFTDVDTCLAALDIPANSVEAFLTDADTIADEISHLR